ncbi:AAA family ATPase [Curtobacterium sp. 9128]|uniref:AAA family ATPase n=1 Tax=Curtobacterium sp. 9128 TaxID=1793722 RepID=UPI0011A4F442|nr:AAA family ATPase [Curtobacterium sp. 9128]
MTATIVLLSGAPGSGKSTLARALQAELGWPRVERDELYAGLMAGAGLTRGDVVPRGVELFWRMTAAYADADCSVIADATLYRDQSEADVRTVLVPAGVVCNVHCRTDLALGRFATRGHGAAMEARVRGNLPRVERPLDLGVPLLEVDTTDGHDPLLADVVRWVRAQNA